ncbi:hypothetical protein PSHT_16223, partial [Puccinia striiformis]
APLSIKIKHADVIHKLQVNQHVPIWSMFSAAIAQRFGNKRSDCNTLTPRGTPSPCQFNFQPLVSLHLKVRLPTYLKLTVTLDSSTQADFDELWHEALSVTAQSYQTGGVDQRNRCLELALINHHPSEAQPPPTIKSAVEEEITHFWKGLPTANLVGEDEWQYLDLKGAYVLGNPELCHRILVRSVYEELREHIDESFAKSKWVVTGTPGVGKTFFSAYYLWVAACEGRTVVWQPFQTQPGGRPTYLLTSDGVERVAYGSPELYTLLMANLHSCAPPGLSSSHILKQSRSDSLFMPPWSYEELQHCKAILYQKLPTTLMDRLYDWYGGVPQYVLARASDEFTGNGGNEDAAVGTVVAILKKAIGKGSLTSIIKAQEAEHLDGEYSHRVLHLCRHPSGSLSQSHLAWASLLAENEVVKRFSQEILNDMKYYLRFSNDNHQSNIRGLIFESYAHVMLRNGGRFQARRLCGSNVTSSQNGEVAFSPAEVQFFEAYEEIKLVKNVLWRPASKNLASIDSLRGPADFFQISVQFDRKLKEQRDQIDTQRNEIISLRKANVSHLDAQPQWTRVVNELEQIKLALTDVFGLLRKPESAAPAELLKKDITYKCQPYHAKDGKLFKGQLGNVQEVE